MADIPREQIPSQLTPQGMNQSEKSFLKKFLQTGTTLSFAIIIGLLLFSLYLIIISILTPEPENADLSPREFGIIIGVVISAWGIPIPLIIYFYLNHQLKKLNRSEPENKSDLKNYLIFKTLFVISVVATFIFLFYLLFNPTAPFK